MTNQEEPSTEASTWIEASPEAVWRRVATIEALGRYSPETYRTEWLPGWQRHEVGARFRGHNSNDRHEWHTDCVISEFTEPEAFAFDVESTEEGDFSTRWRYTLAAEAGGTRLTESFVSPVLDGKPAEMNPRRHGVLVEMLNTTLERIKKDVEATDTNRRRVP